MCLHTIVLDPQNEDCMFAAIYMPTTYGTRRCVRFSNIERFSVISAVTGKSMGKSISDIA